MSSNSPYDTCKYAPEAFTLYKQMSLQTERESLGLSDRTLPPALPAVAARQPLLQPIPPGSVSGPVRITNHIRPGPIPAAPP